ncbi:MULTISPECIES: fluoride efflux transporter FluC [unclassified Microbacterium]|uniref:fluoride efflux transporter FluC n=1 Tax=unclassified Microbacterium TaxID=2609290 RepID=UPI002CBA87BA|nr:CrcB family protein [Microbacterium sp.]HWK79030.1 CrcB family protein [Microbacterium sp.]
MTLRRLLLVIAGGMLGTAARLGIGLLIPNAGLLPVATLVANVVGALLIGVLAARLPFDRLRDRGGDIRVFLGTGILGGFTTYSAFAVGSVQLWTDAPLLAVLYVVMTLGIGLAAAVLGMRWGKTKRRA